jgi:hypothetical protein
VVCDFDLLAAVETATVAEERDVELVRIFVERTEEDVVRFREEEEVVRMLSGVVKTAMEAE